MSLPPDYLDYPRRRHGMDHDRHGWSILPRREPVAWPGGARVALWINVALEWFPLDMQGKPFKAPGAMQTAYPDLRHWTLRDYGNRVGVFRLMKALAERGLTASAAVNGAVATRYPSLIGKVETAGWEIIAHGLDMDSIHHGGLAREAETALVARTLKELRAVATTPIRGWLSPARSESFATPDIVAEAGLDYICDWANDDMPYPMRASAGPLTAMPLSPDIDDYAVLIQNHQTEDDFRDILVDQFECLREEAGRSGGRVMSLSLHPWVVGQPYRMGALEQALDHILARGDVWCATSGAILDAWARQQRSGKA